MKKNMIVPAMALPVKPTEDIDTAIIPAIVVPNPITPIPPALIKPFFTGRMPLPPSVNGAYKIGYIGNHPRIISTPALEQFKQEAMVTLARDSRSFTDFAVLEALRSARIKTPLDVKLLVYYTSEWKRDLDGPEKYAVDAAFDFLGLDDRLVVHKESWKYVDAVDPRVEIEIRCFPR